MEKEGHMQTPRSKIGTEGRVQIACDGRDASYFQKGQIEDQTPCKKTPQPSQCRGWSRAMSRGHEVQKSTKTQKKHLLAKKSPETQIKLGLIFSQVLFQQPQLTPVRAALG